MTTYTTISNALVQVGAYPFASTVQALRDNPLSVFEGDATAHAAGVSIMLPAFDQLVAGSTIRYRDDAVQSTSSISFVEVYRINFIQTGQVTVRSEHRQPAGAANVELRVRRLRAGSSTTIVTWSTNSSTFVVRTQDVDVIPGDSVFLEHRTTNVSLQSEVQGSRLQMDPACSFIPVNGFGNWENL